MDILDIKYAGKDAINHLISLLKLDYVNKQNVATTDEMIDYINMGQLEHTGKTNIATIDEMKMYLSIGSIVLISASVTGSSVNGAELGNYGLGTRATLLVMGGDIKLLIPSTGETTNYGLIQIPAGATSITVTGTKDFHFGVSIFAVDNGKYAQQLDSGWIDMTSDRSTFTIPTDYTDGNHMLSINFRLDSYGNFVADNYANTIGMRFNYN